MTQPEQQTFKKVKSILISQPLPLVKSPYYDLEQKYGIKVDFREFTQVDPLLAKDVRRQKVNPGEFTVIILTSKTAVDHFFRICTEMRVKMHEDTKYFCLTESISNYLQLFINYRKRKVFHGTRSIEDLKSYLVKYRDKEKFLLPCSNLGAKDVTTYLASLNVKWQEAVMYATVSADLSDLRDIFYDVLVFFTPQAITSLFENFPDFKQNDTRIAIFGNSTAKAATEAGLIINIHAPAPDVPSMPSALEKYIAIANKA